VYTCPRLTINNYHPHPLYLSHSHARATLHQKCLVVSGDNTECAVQHFGPKSEKIQTIRTYTVRS